MAESEKEKSNLSTDQYFGCISFLKNAIDTRLDGLEPWLKYLQLSGFEFFKFLKAEINSQVTTVNLDGN